MHALVKIRNTINIIITMSFRFSNNGMNFSISRDDPILFDTHLLLNEYSLAEQIGLSRDDVITSVSIQCLNLKFW